MKEILLREDEMWYPKKVIRNPLNNFRTLLLKCNGHFASLKSFGNLFHESDPWEPFVLHLLSSSSWLFLKLYGLFFC